MSATRCVSRSLPGVGVLAVIGAAIVGLIALHTWLAAQWTPLIAHGMIGGGLLLLALILFLAAAAGRPPKLGARPPLQLAKPAAALGALAVGTRPSAVSRSAQEGLKLRQRNGEAGLTLLAARHARACCRRRIHHQPQAVADGRATGDREFLRWVARKGAAEDLAAARRCGGPRGDRRDFRRRARLRLLACIDPVGGSRADSTTRSRRALAERANRERGGLTVVATAGSIENVDCASRRTGRAATRCSR